MEYDERWHHGLFNGILELGGRYNLDQICPNGWAEIHTETSLANGAVELLQGIALSFVGAPGAAIYTPQTITIVCAAQEDAYRFQFDGHGRLVMGLTSAGPGSVSDSVAD